MPLIVVNQAVGKRPFHSDALLCCEDMWCNATTELLVASERATDAADAQDTSDYCTVRDSKHRGYLAS
ncbi:unnamed protein product [Jaminaea pallidilutea]